MGGIEDHVGGREQPLPSAGGDIVRGRNHALLATKPNAGTGESPKGVTTDRLDADDFGAQVGEDHPSDRGGRRAFGEIEHTNESSEGSSRREHDEPPAAVRTALTVETDE
jgi:hypothetical protein